MRISLLDNEDGEFNQRKLAEMLADGAKREDIARTFGINKDTVSDWKKRADVRAKVRQIIETRANDITSRTDAAILAWLDSNAKKPIETLLKVRSVFEGQTINVKDVDKGEAMKELMLMLHDDEELAAKIGEAFGVAAPDVD